MSGKTFIVVGLGFGDEGKGSIVDFLAREHGAKMVVRFNGGPQCAHNVVLSDGRHHQFHSFGSASLIEGVKTHVARKTFIEPYAMDNEAADLAGTWFSIKESVTVDPLCAVITPYHWLLNRMRERTRGSDRHGSCGFGVGELAHFIQIGYPVIRAFELGDRKRTAEKLRHIREIAFMVAKEGNLQNRGWLEGENIESTAAYYANFAGEMTLRDDEDVALDLDKQVTIFEGAQGILLDQDVGFAPYNTWSDTTPRHALDLIGGRVYTEIIGVTRTYATRHGAGPFITEDAQMEPDVGEHNAEGEYQGRFRVGHFDLEAFWYASVYLARDYKVALTHCDRFPKGSKFKFCANYYSDESHAMFLDKGVSADFFSKVRPKYYEETIDDIVERFQELIGGEIKYASYGPTEKDKRLVSKEET